MRVYKFYRTPLSVSKNNWCFPTPVFHATSIESFGLFRSNTFILQTTLHACHHKIFSSFTYLFIVRITLLQSWLSLSYRPVPLLDRNYSYTRDYQIPAVKIICYVLHAFLYCTLWKVTSLIERGNHDQCVTSAFILSRLLAFSAPVPVPLCKLPPPWVPAISSKPRAERKREYRGRPFWY